jgi:hypothetical protein
MSVGVRCVVSEPRYIRGRTWVVGEMDQPPIVRKLGREEMEWNGGDIGGDGRDGGVVCIMVELVRC